SSCGAHHGNRLHRAPRDPQQRCRLGLLLHPEAVPQPVPVQAHPGRQHLLRRARHRRARRDAGGPRRALRLLPVHHAGPGHARGGTESGLQPTLRYPRGLDARGGVGSGRARRRGGRHDGGADRVPRSQHDGRHPHLRVRLGHAGRLHESGRRGAGRTDRRRDREPGRHLREVHRHRAEADGGAGADPARPRVPAQPGVRAGRGASGLMPPRSWTLTVAGLGLIVALALPFTLSNFRLFQFSQVYISAMALLGLNILTGYNGQISLGHGAFYAVGAYTTAVMIDQWNVPYGWTIPAAGVICLVAGFLFGSPALRLEGLYLALATFALALAVPQILKYFEHWTGGSQGIVLSKPKAPWGLKLNPDQWLYFLCLALLVLSFILASNLLRGRTGRAIVAIRDNPIAAQSMGVNTALYKSLTFGVSAAYTGVAGALSAVTVAYVAPDSFDVFRSITFLVGI